MKKVMRLVGIQLWGVLGDMLSIGKNRSRKPKVIYIGVLFFVAMLSGVSFLYSMMVGSGLKTFDCIYVMPALWMAITCIITFVTTMMKVKGTIFGFRDYDMVMSLPISTRGIVASRLIILYALNFIFVIIMMVPMMISYGILANPNILFYIIGFVTMFFIPLIPIVVASIFGTAIAYAATRFKHSNFVNIIITLTLLVAMVSFSFSLKGSDKELAKMSEAITGQINQLYPFAELYIDCVIHYNILSMVLFLGISAVAFLIYTLVIDRSFKKLNTKIMTGSYHSNYKLGSLKASSPFKALYQKELKRFFSSTLYVTNTGFGIVMLTVAAIAANFVDLNKVIGEPEAVKMMIKMSPVFIVFCIVMTCTSMASISLEGKNFWIIKSLPITPKTVYLSKIAVNLTIISPVFIDIILLGIAFKMSFLNIIVIMLTSAACAIFISFYGLFINLMLPNLSWTSETVVIKNSAATLVTVFSTMAYVIIPLLMIMLIPSTTVACLSFFVLTVVIDGGLYAALMTIGNRRYYML